MNGQDFSNNLNALINTAANSGASINEIVSALELCKLDLVRNAQDMIRARQQQILKAQRIPNIPPPNGERP